ncbi:MAG: hypothetical protein FJ088_11440, partial [Deltaproteobacteria bacterium]|nr:hypothetical protein [Deltaproteobacteria bacterium]
MFQDTVAPSVLTLSSPSDTEAPANYLNIAEQKATPRVYALSGTATEGGTAVFYVNGASSGNISAPSGTANLDASLKEGGNEIYAVFQDGVGNYSPAPPDSQVLYYSPTVDTSSPTISFLNPVKTPVISGESLDVVVGSNAIGQNVTLRNNGNFVASLQVQPNGTATFTHSVYNVLTDGYHTLKAEVADFAGNPAQNEIAVYVDTALPDITLLLPGDLDEYADADDEQPSIGGFQIKAIFGAVSNDSDTWKVSLASNCDNQYNNCGPFEEAADGDITNPGGLEPDLILTIPTHTSVEYYRLKLEVKDVSGNQNSFTVRIKISLSNCVMTLTGLPSSGYYNNSYCQTAGENCASINVAVKAQFVGPCGNIDKIDLLKNGSVADSKPVSGSEAEFNLTLANGETFTLQAKGYEGATEKAASGVSNLAVDLLDPVPLFVTDIVGGFTTPASGSNNTYNATHDLSGSADFQMNLKLEASDANIIGGQFISLSTNFGSGDTALSPSNVTLPYTIAASPLSISLLDVTLKDQRSHTVKA